MSARRRLLRAVRPITRLLDHVNLRIGRPTLHGRDYHNALAIMRTGDIVLTRTAWRPSNILLPGRWTHALMVVSGDVLVEATLPVVRTVWLVDVWAGATQVLIVRPRFLDAEQAQIAASYAASRAGTPYDLEFDPSPRELYCSELVYRALRRASPTRTPHLATTEFGVSSIKPDALANDKHFETLIEAGSNKEKR